MNVVIKRNEWDGGIGIYLLEVLPDGRRMIGKPMDILFETYYEGESNIKPTISINYDYAEQFLAAFAKELDNKGIKTENDHKIIGTLEATRIHLEDMRRLVFDKAKQKKV